MIDQKNRQPIVPPIELFYFAYRAFTARADQLLGERGLGRVHHRILYFVGRSPQIAINALLGTLGVSKQALNAPLRQLLEKQLVAVEIAEHDRRVKLLSLTEQGRALEAQLTGIQTQHLDAAFASAGSAATEGWLAVMRTMHEQG